MPLAGSSDTATPILMKACTAVTTARPAPANWQKGSRALAERSSSRTVRRQNRAAMMAHSTRPNSSPATAKI